MTGRAVGAEAGDLELGGSGAAGGEGTWFVDSSVLLCVVYGSSAKATAWFDGVRARGERLVASRMLRLEVLRSVLNKEVAGIIKPGALDAGAFLAEFDTMPITPMLLDDAETLAQPLGGADAIHLASALFYGSDNATFVTHDRQQARAARNLGMAVHDPVTDDPILPPVC